MESLSERDRTLADRPAGEPRDAAGRASVARALLVSMRPPEWIKNLLVYAGLLFSQQFDDPARVLDATLAFIAFCAISSAGYLVNDLRDVAFDRRHPEKRHRPIASGVLAERVAWTAAIVLAVAAVALALAAVSAEVGGLVALYGAITVAYSLILKRLVILDVMTIASLFILRVVAGAVAVDAQASEWLLLCTGMLALFLGFTKRRQEAIEEMESRPAESSAAVSGSAGEGKEAWAAASGSAESGVTRPVLEHYSVGFLDQMVSMVTAAAIVSYAIYAVDSPKIGSEMLATAPSVLYGIFRYLYLIYDRRDTRSTAAILTEDPGMIFAGVTWVGTALLMLYAFN
jgi:4-hydroxybenzoate polyprenyltransferase